MAGICIKRVLAAFVGTSLVCSSTAGTASALKVPQANPWAVLTAMSGGAPAASICGAAAAAAAAQAPGGCVLPILDTTTAPVVEQGPPPPAPIPPIFGPSEGFGLGVSPLLLGALAIAAGVGIYFAVRHGNSPT